MLTEGFFWFQDLSSPDPLCILPVLGGIINILNMLNTSSMSSSTTMRKMRKYIIILPILTVPIWMTFPVVSSLKNLVTSMIFLGFQLVLDDFLLSAIAYSFGIQEGKF